MKKLFLKPQLKAVITFFKKPHGMALMLVIVIMAIMLPLVTDMNYEAKTEYEIAMNYKRKAEAKVLARSSVAFATVVFDLQKQLDAALKQFGITQKIDIWDVVPFDTAILRGFLSAGPFASLEDIPDTKEESEKQAKENEAFAAEKKEEGDPMFDFPGDFRIEFENEDTKINLNLIDSAAKDAISKMLMGIVESDNYDFIFEENTSRKEYVTREELIANIIDWVDLNSEKEGSGGGNEDDLYADFIPSYKVKNARFDTISELRMVYGIDDIIFRLLYPYITIYSTGKINLGKADASTIEAIIRSYAVDKSMSVFYNEEMMRELMGKVLAKRAKDGFNQLGDFTEVLKAEGIELPNVANIAGVDGNVYRIRAIGVKDEVESFVEMVVDREGNIYFYKEG